MTNPFAGSALVYWDNGPVRPDGSTGNGPTPLAEHAAARGQGPARAPRNTPAAREQKSQFLLTGNVVDVCGGDALHVGLHEAALGHEVAAAERRHPDRGQRRGHC